MDKFKGVAALRKTIELVLQKLNMYQDTMNEISREELLEIMGNENLDLSWIASQESVNELARLVNILGSNLLENWDNLIQPEPIIDEIPDVFEYLIVGDKVHISALKVYNDDLGEYDDLVIKGKYKISDKVYTTIVGDGTDLARLINPNLRSITIADDVGCYKLPLVTSCEIDGVDYTNNNLQSIDFSGLALLEKPVFIPGNFRSLRSLTSLNLSFKDQWVCTSGISFSSCSKLTRLDLTHIDFSKCNSMTMGNMFSGCISLTEILVSRNEWPADLSMAYDMFKNCGVDHVTFVN